MKARDLPAEVEDLLTRRLDDAPDVSSWFSQSVSSLSGATLCSGASGWGESRAIPRDMKKSARAPEIARTMRAASQ